MTLANEIRTLKKEVEALKEAKLKSISMMPIVNKSVTVTLNRGSQHNWFILDIETADGKTPLFMICYKVVSGPQPRLIDSSRRYLGSNGRIAIKHYVGFPTNSASDQITLEVTVRCTNDFNLLARVK